MSEVNMIDLPFPLFKRGKVRDVFESDEGLLIVSSDRISAFDFVLPSLIPDKGKVLNKLALFFFELTRDLIPNHILNPEPEKLSHLAPYKEVLNKRSMLVRRVKPFPVEAIVRSYLVGSGWKSYQQTGQLCGITLPSGLSFADRFPDPVFTPSTKAESGHDENISFDELKTLIGAEDADSIRDLSLKLFVRASEYAFEKGIIIADSKFEFGKDENGRIILIDEIFTPDSSRFWKRQDYQPGKEPPAFDKQYVRNYLLSSSWDRESPPPPLPEEVVEKTREKYLEIFQILTGNPL